MKFEQIAQLLREFDYQKNGKRLTVHFLIRMLDELLNGGE